MNTQDKIAAYYRVGNYNDRRYGRPWIAAIVAWEIGKFPELAFGASSSREAELAAVPGQVVKFGQKDYRNLKKSENEFGLVRADGSLLRVTEGVARKCFRGEISALDIIAADAAKNAAADDHGLTQ